MRVSVVDVLPAVADWDRDEVTIHVRRGEEWDAVLREVHAILADLGAPLPFTDGVPRCFCGDPVPLPDSRAGGTRRHRIHSVHVWQVSRGA
jgi:hypothetical protein